MEETVKENIQEAVPFIVREVVELWIWTRNLSLAIDRGGCQPDFKGTGYTVEAGHRMEWPAVQMDVTIVSHICAQLSSTFSREPFNLKLRELWFTKIYYYKWECNWLYIQKSMSIEHLQNSKTNYFVSGFSPNTID